MKEFKAGVSFALGAKASVAAVLNNVSMSVSASMMNSMVNTTGQAMTANQGQSLQMQISTTGQLQMQP